jgi:hypothetical protein
LIRRELVGGDENVERQDADRLSLLCRLVNRLKVDGSAIFRDASVPNV